MAEITARMYLKDGSSIEFGKRQILEIESTTQSNSDPESVFYGATDSRGRIKIKDIDGDIYKKVENNEIDKSDFVIEIFYNNKLYHRHIAATSSYDINSKILSIELEGTFRKLAKEDYAGFDLMVGLKDLQNQTKELFAIDLFTKILQDLNYSQDKIDVILSKYIIDAKDNYITLNDYLSNIYVPAAYVKSGTKKIDLLNWLCELTQLQCFEDADGELKFISARPAIINIDKVMNNVLVIKANNQYSDFDNSVILNNEIKSVGYNERKFLKRYEKLETCGINFYDQTNVADVINIDNSSQYLYSALFSDYNENITYQTNGNLKVYGIYPIPTGSIGERGAVIKYSFNIEDYIIDYNIYKNGNLSFYFNIFAAQTNNINENKNYDDSNGTFNSKFFLVNKNHYIGIDLDSTLFPWITNPQFVNTEEEALNNLCNIVDEKIESIKVSGYPYSIVQIVKNGNIFDCYTIIFGITYGSPNMIHQGDLGEIILNSSVDMYVNTLIEEVTEVNIDSNTVLENGQFLQKGCLYKDEEMYDLMQANILQDYKDGVSTGRITVSVSDYYNINNDLVKRAALGELLSVGDIVRIDKDDLGNSIRFYKDGTPMLWEVVGKTLRKKGTPFIDLELMEVKQIEIPSFKLSKGSATVTRIASSAGADLKELTNSDIIYKGDTLQIKYSSGVRLYSISMGGSVIKSGTNVDSIDETIVVSGDISITIERKSWRWVDYNLGTVWGNKQASGQSGVILFSIGVSSEDKNAAGLKAATAEYSKYPPDNYAKSYKNIVLTYYEPRSGSTKTTENFSTYGYTYNFGTGTYYEQGNINANPEDPYFLPYCQNGSYINLPSILESATANVNYYIHSYKEPLDAEQAAHDSLLFFDVIEDGKVNFRYQWTFREGSAGDYISGYEKNRYIQNVSMTVSQYEYS